MFLRDPDVERPLPRDRSWSSRIARGVLLAGLALLAVRATAATVVTVRGNGMAPTIVDGEPILVLRGATGVRPGDVVLYEPPPLQVPLTPPPDGEDEGHTGPRGGGAPDVHRSMRNTAVVDREDLEGNWSKVRKRSGGIVATVRRKALRVGRVVAVPGQTVTFNVPDVPLGLLVDGAPIVRKPAAPLALALPAGPDTAVTSPEPVPTAYETVGDRRFRVVLERGHEIGFSGLGLPPPEDGPVEIPLDGYLVLADNREEGACCDSRALGVIASEAIEGRVLARLLARRGATPGLDPNARGFAWMP
ncbi:MAG: hypothetical protein D6705_07910 [Deltaproteobacteria bacterium]|nr:MAG: hypothetical protein D6705_07910 [Deltaproteobacteria bacterium]